MFLFCLWNQKDIWLSINQAPFFSELFHWYFLLNISYVFVVHFLLVGPFWLSCAKPFYEHYRHLHTKRFICKQALSSHNIIIHLSKEIFSRLLGKFFASWFIIGEIYHIKAVLFAMSKFPFYSCQGLWSINNEQYICAFTSDNSPLVWSFLYVIFII